LQDIIFIILTGPVHAEYPIRFIPFPAEVDPCKRQILHKFQVIV